MCFVSFTTAEQESKGEGTCSSPLWGFFAAVGNTHVSLLFTEQESESRKEREFPLALVCCCFGYAPYCSLAMRRCCVYVCVCVSCDSRLCSASASLRFFVCAATDRPNRRERLAERNWILIGKTRARQEANVNSLPLLLSLLVSLPTFGCSFGCCFRVANYFFLVKLWRQLQNRQCSRLMLFYLLLVFNGAYILFLLPPYLPSPCRS